MEIWTIKMSGFVYHVKKGILCKGSIVKEQDHPNDFVNKYKEILLSTGKLIAKNGGVFILKKNVEIGALLAYNLHTGKTENTIPGWDKLTNKDISYDIGGTQHISYDNFLISRLYAGILEKVNLYEMKLNIDFFIGNSPSEFSESELFISEVLAQVGEISKCIHGNAQEMECDIIDKENGIQIEIVNEFRSSVKDKHRMRDNRMPFIEDISYYSVPSEALMKKLFKKNYSEKYILHLACFLIGTPESAALFFKQMDLMFEQHWNLKNHFQKIHIIMYNPYSDSIIYFNDCPKTRNFKQFSIAEFDVQIILKKNVETDEIVDDKDYLLKINELINNQEHLSILSGKTMKKYLSLNKVQ